MENKILALVVTTTLLIITFLVAIQTVSAATLEVGPGKPYSTIQAAVDAAGLGDTVLVYPAPGPYGPFNVSGKVDLTIVANQTHTVTINGSQSVATNYANRDTVVFVENSVNVTIEGFDIEGYGLGTVNAKNYGVIYENSSGTIRDCIVSPNTIDDMNGVAIGAWDGSDLTVDPCTIKNFGRIGVFYFNGCSGGVYDSTIIGQVYSDADKVNYGIEVEGLYGACDIEIIGNDIYNCDNTNPSPSWTSAGILIDGWMEYYAPPTMQSSTVIMEENDIYDNYIGIDVVANSLSHAHYNDIYDNRIYGVSSGSDSVGNNVTFDARFNWWGDASGPTHPSNIGGTGDKVTENVLYSPWFGFVVGTTPMTYHVNPTGKIQDAIDDANSGDTIIVHPGTYTEYLHVTTDNLTVQGAGIDQSIIDLDGLTPYWHYAGCSRSYASRAGVLISGYDSPDEIVENITFRGFTVKNAGLNPPITATGTHTGSDNASVLVDSTASWTPGALVGLWVHNLDDRDIDYSPSRSYGQITANTAMTVTATLTGGVENDWDSGDAYVITYEHFYDQYGDGQDDVRGVSIANGKNILIQNCKVVNSGYGGITVGKARCVSTHKYSEGVTIDNCISSDHPVSGISVGTYIGPVTITNNIASNNKRPHLADPTREYQGFGIQVSGKSATSTLSGVISNNTCTDNGFEGIIVTKYTDGVTVENNIVTGHNFDQDGAGIFLYHWGHPEHCKNHIIRNNTVTGNIRGIIAYYASNCTIENNTITTDCGTFPKGQGAIKIDGSNNIEVKNNVIGTSDLDGTGISVVYWEGYGTVSSYGNTFTGNTITGAQFAGIFISGDAHDNTFINNTITGTTSLTRWEGTAWEETQADGVFIDDDAGTGNVFHYNNIYDNDDDGMENQIPTTVDARFNWWGDASGPEHPSNPGGVGDSVSDNVDYSPWLGFVVGTSPMTWHVNPTGAPGAIQEAIDEASPSDTIIVHSGTYNENLAVNKALTIQAASRPVIDGGASGDCISVSTSNVVVSGFEIRNGYNGIAGQTSGSTFSNNIIHDNLNIPGSAGIGILLWGDNDDNIIMGNEIYDNDRQGIFIGYQDDSKISTGNLIKDNVIYNNGLYTYPTGPDASAYGIQLWCADGNIIKNNEIYGHDDWFPYPDTHPTFDFAQGIYLCDANDNTIVNNYLHDNNYGVGLWHPARPLGNNYINYNDIAGNTGYGVCNYDGIQVDARFNWWGDASGPTHSSNPSGTGDKITDNVLYSPWFGFIVGTTPMTYHVNPTGKIQDAIDDASSGDTILVYDGTYREALYINKSLSLKAASSPVIESPDTVPARSFTGPSGTQTTHPVVFVAGDIYVTIEGFTIDGRYLASANQPSFTGIQYFNASGVIKNNTIKAFRDEPLTGNIGLGITVNHLWDQYHSHSVEIMGNTIFDYSKNGITCNEPGTVALVRNNVVTGSGLTDKIAQNGIQFGWNATGVIEGNIVSGHKYTDVASWWSCGILLYLYDNGTSILCNNVTDNNAGIYVYASSDVVAHYNNIYGNTEYGLYNYPSAVVDARFNWWGDPSGPYHNVTNTGGLGDRVSDNVDYDPWLDGPIPGDVAIVSITPSRNMACEGQILDIYVTVKNEGDLTVTFDVTLYYDNNTIGTLTVTDLAPGANTTLTFSWDTTGVTPCTNYTISAEASTLPCEAETANNLLVDGEVKINIMGDINGDGIVNMKDIYQLIAAFGSYPSHRLWNPALDLNNDNKIDMKDIYLAIASFGKTCP